MGCFVPPSFDNGLGLRVDGFTFEIVVDLVIGNTKCDFVSKAWFVFFQVCSRDFEVEFSSALSSARSCFPWRLLRRKRGECLRHRRRAW